MFYNNMFMGEINLTADFLVFVCLPMFFMIQQFSVGNSMQNIVYFFKYTCACII